MFNNRLDKIGDYPFDRLRALLGPVEVQTEDEPISLALGEPQHPPPAMIQQAVNADPSLWGRYPPMKGPDDLRHAIADWMTRRYALPGGMIDPDQNVIPVSGTREALFLIALAAVPEKKAGKQPVVLMPNPFYQVYLGAAVLAGAEPVFLPADRDTGFLPDFDAIPKETLERTALAYYCSPANPQGAIASMETMKKLIAMAREYDFVLASDECYSEIYDSDDAPPTGAVEACAALGGGSGDGLDNVAIFNSLSKRSSAPGLRAGFVAGEADFMKRYLRLRDYSGAPPPLPLAAAAAACWRDEAHVIENRTQYRHKFDIAERYLSGRFGFSRSPGGFYLWLDVGDGEAAARKLWRDAAIRVIPGEYLSRTDSAGGNPGRRYIRCALVQNPQITETAITRLAAVLEELLEELETLEKTPS